MPKTPAKSTYARVVGEISIGWNRIERDINTLAFYYMKEDSTVAGFILGSMGNQTRSDFLTLLVNRFETREPIREHLIYVIKLVNRIRENRNIIEHAEPALSREERYLGKIAKLNKVSNLSHFEAPIHLLKEMAETIEKTISYIRNVRFTQVAHDGDDGRRHEGGPTMSEASLQVLASIGKPPLPRKLDPLRLQ